MSESVPPSPQGPDSSAARPASPRGPVPLLLAILAAYALTCLAGWPQAGRDRVVQGQHAVDSVQQPHEAGAHPTAPPPLTTLPFVLLLAAIAIFPLAPGISHWWEHNSSKLLVAGVLAAVTLLYYLLSHAHPVDLHFPAHAVIAPSGGGLSWGTTGAVLANALLSEYVPFIALLLALYVTGGGVLVKGTLIGTPATNTALLAFGTVIASVMGTTGASMLLIRPVLRANSFRQRKTHTFVFFIFRSAILVGR